MKVKILWINFLSVINFAIRKMQATTIWNAYALNMNVKTEWQLIISKILFSIPF